MATDLKKDQRIGGSKFLLNRELANLKHHTANYISPNVLHSSPKPSLFEATKPSGTSDQSQRIQNLSGINQHLSRSRRVDSIMSSEEVTRKQINFHTDNNLYGFVPGWYAKRGVMTEAQYKTRNAPFIP